MLRGAFDLYTDFLALQQKYVQQREQQIAWVESRFIHLSSVYGFVPDEAADYGYERQGQHPLFQRIEFEVTQSARAKGYDEDIIRNGILRGLIALGWQA